MPTDRELMQQALDALERGLTSGEWRELIDALRARLAQCDAGEICLGCRVCPDAQPEQTEIKLPTSVEQAEAMEKIGYAYLKQHAPHRLAQPEPEPVAWSVTYHGSHCNNIFSNQVLAENERKRLDEEYGSDARTVVPLYTAPPRKEWQGLTDEERSYLAWESNNGKHCVAMTEAKLREKNHAA